MFSAENKYTSSGVSVDVGRWLFKSEVVKG